jgi:hypothetical protein
MSPIVLSQKKSHYKFGITSSQTLLLPAMSSGSSTRGRWCGDFLKVFLGENNKEKKK